jgi:hypothetical protein
MDDLPIDVVREKTYQEVNSPGTDHPSCEFVCEKALEEMKEKPPERPFSRLFYELAFFYREEKSLALAYKVWFPVMRSWIIRWDMDLMEDQLDDVVDDLIYSTFDALFLSIIQNRFVDFEAGKVHNYLRKTLQLKVFGRFRQEKRRIVSLLNKGRKKLEEYHIRILRELIGPRFSETRSNLECKLFEEYILENLSVSELVNDNTLLQELGEVSDPVKALHNRVQTILWNVYKLLKRQEANNTECHELLQSWIGMEYTARWM